MFATLNETDFHAGDKSEIVKFRRSVALSDRSQKDLSGPYRMPRYF